MRKHALLAALAFAIPAIAQTEGQDKKAPAKTQKLWKIECSGIGG